MEGKKKEVKFNELVDATTKMGIAIGLAMSAKDSVARLVNCEDTKQLAGKKGSVVCDRLRAIFGELDVIEKTFRSTLNAATKEKKWEWK